MPFSLKLKDIVQLNESGNVSLREGLRNVITAKGLPIKTSYHLAKIGRSLQAELQAFFEARSALIKELGAEVLDEGKPTGMTRVKPENFEAFAAQSAELLDADFTVDLDPVKIDSLGDKADLSPADLMACEKIIID